MFVSNIIISSGSCTVTGPQSMIMFCESVALVQFPILMVILKVYMLLNLHIPILSSYHTKSPYSCKVAFITLYCDPYPVFPGDSVVKNLPINALDIRDSGSIPGLGRSPGEGNINPLQCFCLGNPMDRGIWQVHGLQELDIT